MKKFLFASLLLTGLVFLVPSAQAGCPKRVMVGYDRFGHPVYREVYAPSYVQPRPVYYYNAPVRYQAPVYGRDYDYGRTYQRSSCSSSRPRVSISFGF
jgi:hypothetical protein